ncbi:hypothetical protein HN937_10375 [Candidatus Poribacteria bacterium]|nr:hypothetical protein [Candidatus Poribacteria bacterium]
MRSLLKGTVGALTIALATWTAGNAAAQCVELDAAAVDVPFTTEMAADANAVYLSVVGGDTPTPNDCGLLASNDPALWMGWGGPLDVDNASIGEGPGTRNFVTIGGTRYARGIGTHSDATFGFDLSGGNYERFMAYVGMDDEKDAGAAGAGDSCGFGGTSEFTVSVDGSVVFESGLVTGMSGADNVAPVLVDVDVTGASDLEIAITGGDDGIGCDHAAIGDPKLQSSSTAVDPAGKTTTTWSTLKQR